MAPPREPDARVVRLLAVVAHGREIFAAALHPLDRPSEPVGRGGHQDLLGIDRPLAEAAADVGHDDAHVLDRQAERGDHVAQRVRALRGRRHHERARIAVGVGEDAARLDRHGAETRVPQPLVDDEVRARQRPLGVADGAARHQGRVVGPASCRRRCRRRADSADASAGSGA